VPRIADATLDAARERKLTYAAGTASTFLSPSSASPARSPAGRSASARARPPRCGQRRRHRHDPYCSAARRCGIGSSIRALGTEPISLPRLLTQQGPEKVLHRVAASAAGATVAGLHCFPFGGFAPTARWLQAVAAGRFRLDESGFVVDLWAASDKRDAWRERAVAPSGASGNSGARICAADPDAEPAVCTKQVQSRPRLPVDGQSALRPILSAGQMGSAYGFKGFRGLIRPKRPGTSGAIAAGDPLG
jgi:hypothetical protein